MKHKNLGGYQFIFLEDKKDLNQVQAEGGVK